MPDITEVYANIDAAPNVFTIGTKTLVGIDQYDYTSDNYTLSNTDRDAILAILANYI